MLLGMIIILNFWVSLPRTVVFKMEDFLLKKQINEVSRSKSSKLKMVKFSLDSDEENSDKQSDITKVVSNCKKESDEVSQYTEDIIENSQVTPIKKKKSKSKLKLSSKNRYYSNETVNTSLKISEIDIDNVSNFEEPGNEKNIFYRGTKVEYFNKKDLGEISEDQNSRKENNSHNIDSTELDLVKSNKRRNQEEKSKTHSLYTDHQISFSSKRRKINTEEVTPQSLKENSKKSNSVTSNNKTSSLDIDSMVEEVLELSVLNTEAKLALKNLNIKIYWDLPTAHRLDNGSHNLSRVRKTIEEALKKEGLVWKTKVYYSSEECRIIRNNWEEFSELYGFEDPSVFFRSKEYVHACKLKERLKFKLFLAKGLPDRPLCSVYHKFIELYGCHQRGRWTEKEDMILTGINTAELKDEALSKHILICKVLDRNWMSVHRRMLFLASNKEMRERAKPIEWTKCLMVEVLENLLENTNSKSVEDLRRMHISDAIWNSISNKMDIIALQLKRFWFERFYAQLFATQKIYRRHLKIKLIEWFYNSHYDRWKEISWTEISDRMYSVGKLFIYTLFRQTVEAKVPREKWKDLRETVDYLYLNYLPQLKSNNRPDLLLTRLKYCPKKHDLIEIDDICSEDNYVENKVKRNYFDGNEVKIKRKKNLFQQKLRACVKKKKSKKKKTGEKELGAKRAEKDQNVDFTEPIATKEKNEYKKLREETHKPLTTRFKNQTNEAFFATGEIENENSVCKKLKNVHSGNSDSSSNKELFFENIQNTMDMSSSIENTKKQKYKCYDKDEGILKITSTDKSSDETDDLFKENTKRGQSSRKIKFSKKKHRNLKNGDIYKQGERSSEEKYSDESNASNHDTNNFISLKKKCKQERLGESSNDITEKEEFENNTYENESIIKIKKSRKSKHIGCYTDASEIEGELILHNVSDNSLETNLDTNFTEKGNSIQEEGTSVLKKISKSKHKKIEAEFFERERLLDEKNDMEFHKTLKKSMKKEPKNIAQDSVVSNEDLPLREVLTEHNSLENHIDAIDCEENDISPMTSKKSSKTKPAFHKEECKERNKELNAFEETSSFYKKPSKTKHGKIEVKSNNEENILEEIEDKSLSLASKISNRKHFSEGNAETEHSFFRNLKQINATSTVQRLNKREHKHVQEDYFDKSLALPKNEEENYTPKTSKKAHKKKKRDTEVHCTHTWES